MTSHVRSTFSRTQAPTVPWVAVAVFLLGAGVLASAALAWSVTLLVLGVALVVAAVLATAVLTRPGTGR